MHRFFRSISGLSFTRTECLPQAWGQSLLPALLIALMVPTARAETCSPDQQEIYQSDTPYAKMMALTQSATLLTMLASAMTPNHSGQQSPVWLAGYGFAWLNGVFKGPSCADIPAAYVDEGAEIALDKTALSPDRDAHSRMFQKFAQAYAVDLLLLAGVMIDTDNPLVHSMALFAAAAPAIGFGLHEWQSFEKKKKGPLVTGLIVPENNSGRYRVMLGLVAEIP